MQVGKSRVTGSLAHGEAGHGTGKGLCGLRMHTGSNGLILDRRNGVGHLGAERLTAVSGNHRLLQHVGIVPENHGKRSSVPDDFGRFVADAGDDQQIVNLRIGLDKRAVIISDNTRGKCPPLMRTDAPMTGSP